MSHAPRVIAMLLAGGQGSRLSLLSKRRAKPAVPFGGAYRIIDFPMTNIMRADIGIVGVLTQYKPHSLAEHIGSGESWGLTGRNRMARVLPPYTGDEDNDWYAGTADAIWQNREFIQRFDPDIVLILSGDHIYSMDYAAMIREHIERRAEVTIAVQPVPWEDTPRFGLVSMEDDGRVKAFQEKPKQDPISNLASLGIYVFDAQVLLRRLQEDANDPDSKNDFGSDVLPRMLAHDRMYTHVFEGYWRDVGTIESYWQAHMESLQPEQTGLNLHDWQIHTNNFEKRISNYFPTVVGPDGAVRNSYVGRGCVVDGTVENSVLFPGVRVEAGAVVRDSVIFPDCRIEGDSLLQRCILDKDVVVGRQGKIGNAEINCGSNERHPDLLCSGLTLIGEKAILPPGMDIGTNVLIFPRANERNMPGSRIESGATICGE